MSGTKLSEEPIKEPKVLRRETFKLSAWDKHIISGLAATVQYLQTAMEQAQANVTAYLSRKAQEDWDFPEDASVYFENLSIKSGEVTVVQTEEPNVPKETSDAPAGSNESDADDSQKQPSNEGEKAAE